jgi:hypothetical protein
VAAGKGEEGLFVIAVAVLSPSQDGAKYVANNRVHLYQS